MASVSEGGKQKGEETPKAQIILDENNHIVALKPPEGWTTAPERLNESIWSDELESYMTEIFGLHGIRVVMAST